MTPAGSPGRGALIRTRAPASRRTAARRLADVHAQTAATVRQLADTPDGTALAETFDALAAAYNDYGAASAAREPRAARRAERRVAVLDDRVVELLAALPAYPRTAAGAGSGS